MGFMFLQVRKDGELASFLCHVRAYWELGDLQLPVPRPWTSQVLEL